MTAHLGKENTPMQTEPITQTDEEEDLAPVAFDEASYRRLLAEQGVSEALIESLVAPIKAQAADSARRAAREQSRSLKDYRSNLLAEFSLPDSAPISGTTKAELRRSAQAQRAFADSIAATLAPAAGGAAAGTPAAVAAAAAAAARKANEDQFIQPPGGATPVIADRVTAAWGDQHQKAMGGSRRASEARPSVQSKEEVLADIQANGVPRVNRPSMTTILARGGQPGGS